MQDRTTRIVNPCDVRDMGSPHINFGNRLGFISIVAQVLAFGLLGQGLVLVKRGREDRRDPSSSIPATSIERPVFGRV